MTKRERSGECGHVRMGSIVRYAGGALLLFAAYTVVRNFGDIKRYVKITNM
jgi:hypothetical protein